MGSLLSYAWRTIVDARSPEQKAQAELSRRIAPGQIFGKDLQLKRCRYGWMLFYGPYIGKCFELYGEYSESEVAMMRRFVRPGDRVVDVGANIGDLTLPLAQMVGPAGTVHAVESHAGNYNVLCANLALNDVTNVRPMNVYMTLPSARPPAGGQSPFVSEQWPPPPLALDELELDRCRLVKIDVDGHEIDVLRSGERLVERTRPVLYVENDVRERSPALLRYLDSLDYDLYWHGAPIIEPENFYGNVDNYWAPEMIISAMVLALPRGSGLAAGDLERVKDFDDWWNL
jgi:hypothetical protein